MYWLTIKVVVRPRRTHEMTVHRLGYSGHIVFIVAESMRLLRAGIQSSVTMADNWNTEITLILRDRKDAQK